MSGSGSKINSSWFQNRKSRTRKDSYDLLRKDLSPAQGSIQQTVFNDWVFPLPSYVTGSLAATETPDAFAGSGGVIVSGAMAATEAADTFASSGVVVVSGSLAATESADTFAGSGAVIVSGALAATETADSFSGAGGVTASGSLAATETSDTFAGTGFVVSGSITGSMAATEAPDSFSGGGYIGQILVIDGHDGVDLREKFKEEMAARDKKRAELVKIYEQIAEHRPAVQEIVKEFAQETASQVIPSPSINFDKLLESLNAVQSLHDEYAEHDDEEALVMLI